MLFNIYAIMAGLALFLNRADWRMVFLTLAVTASVFVPVPRESAEMFYAFCMAAEALVAIIAWRLKARASELVISACMVLELVHIMGYSLNGYPPLSSYRVLVPLLELAQLTACICASPTLYARLQNRSP